MNKTQQNPKYQICEHCNFNSCNKKDFNRHMLTAKHLRLTNTNENTNVLPKVFSCECGKNYKHVSSLCKHKKKCDVIIKRNAQSLTTNNTEMSSDKESLILTLITQNKELMNLLASQQQEHKEETKELLNTIQEIVPKIGNNNNNNTTNNNKFNLQVFLNEDCKDAINFSEFIESIQVSVEDLENQSQLGYVGGISKLFLENMKELGTNKRPLHCTDKKRNTLYIKENNEWDKDGSQEQLLHGIKVITGRAHQTLCNMKEENPEEYSDMDSDFSNKCVNIQRSLLPGFPRESTFGKVIDSISNGSIVEKEP
jgi:hypothetical protein